VTGPAQVFESPRPIYVKDDKFRQDFSTPAVDTGSRRKKTAKYILSRLESDVSNRDCDPDTDPATIEHILPENPGEEWIGSYPEKRWEEDVYRIGNLTLLESYANR